MSSTQAAKKPASKVTYAKKYKKLQVQTETQTKIIQSRIDELREKYFHLVWLARSDGDDPRIVKERERVCSLYPQEIMDLDRHPDWSHGFNSGMLAALRLLRPYTYPMDYEEKDIELTRDSEIAFAESQFPWLDT